MRRISYRVYLLTPSHLTVTFPLSLQREGQSEFSELGVSEKLKKYGDSEFELLISNTD
jgi:hypothetical protein